MDSSEESRALLDQHCAGFKRRGGIIGIANARALSPARISRLPTTCQGGQNSLGLARANIAIDNYYYHKSLFHRPDEGTRETRQFIHSAAQLAVDTIPAPTYQTPLAATQPSRGCSSVG
ncbi:hypothetical protein [Phenylobacterium koreense]|uniref:hypothetical protein n=1 Tax=Phenylobacterium koreense TaxID=266125 RepID=UPI0033914169